MKYVRETAAGKSIAAFLILKGDRQVATLQVHYGSSRVLVNIWQDKEAYCFSYAAAKHGKRLRTLEQGEHRAAFDSMQFQSRDASGYGYDKLTAALAGLWIDGYLLTDHCNTLGIPKRPKGRKLYPRDFKTPRGYDLANYVPKEITFGFNSERFPNPNYDGEEGYSSCFRASGLDYLKALGYRVIQVI